MASRHRRLAIFTMVVKTKGHRGGTQNWTLPVRRPDGPWQTQDRAQQSKLTGEFENPAQKRIFFLFRQSDQLIAVEAVQ